MERVSIDGTFTPEEVTMTAHAVLVHIQIEDDAVVGVICGLT